MKSLSVITLVSMSLLLSACAGGPPPSPGASLEEAAAFNVQLGLEYLTQGRRDLAFEKLQRALEQDPRSGIAHSAMAYARNEIGETRLARQHYERAMRLDRNNAEIRNNYGAFLFQHGELREAERQFLAAARNPAYSTPEVAWTNAGICAERDADLEKAERYYREALRINARHADALARMAQVSLDRGNGLQARGFLQRYLDVASQSAEASWLGYRIEVTLGDEAAAREHARRLRTQFAGSAERKLLEDAERGRGR